MVNIQSSNGFIPETPFCGAYEKRLAQHQADTAKAASEQTERQSFQDYKGEGATVTMSKESQEFMAGVADRKAAQLAAKKELEKECSTNPFTYRGNLASNEPTQWLVFSENLYKNGFYDGMSDEKVKEMEDLLKSITYGMGSLSNSSDVDRLTSMSHEAANLELISSVNALHYFADAYVPETMREAFKDLIKQYEDYNSVIVDSHKNIDDMRDESMKNISAPNAVNVNEAVKKQQEETKASQAIGKVTHSDEEAAKQNQNYQALFDKLISGKSDTKDIFDDLKALLVNYAAGNSKNDTVLALLDSRNTASINNMYQYWSVLLGS